jgi:L-ribulokinase
MKNCGYTVGLDFGTNSVRALVVRCSDGREVGTSVVPYPSRRPGHPA